MRVVWQSEIDPYASAVLRRHWPSVPNLGDIRGISAATLADADARRQQVERLPQHAGEQSPSRYFADRRRPRRRRNWPEVLCGGFPCQDISNAGKRAGIDGERSGLWSEFARLIGEIRPRYAIMENVAALLGRGLDRILGDLAALGYDAEWHCIPASAVGAPHRRDRIWIVAYAHRPSVATRRGAGHVVSATREIESEGLQRQWLRDATDDSGANVADASVQGLPASEREGLLGTRWGDERRAIAECGWWSVEPDVGRVAHGVSRRVDRLRCLGNAIVPQVAEIIGRAIVSAER
jgi:DNA (cytosine-5)-methyltransferase 1